MGEKKRGGTAQREASAPPPVQPRMNEGLKSPPQRRSKGGENCAVRVARLALKWGQKRGTSNPPRGWLIGQSLGPGRLAGGQGAPQLMASGGAVPRLQLQLQRILQLLHFLRHRRSRQGGTLRQARARAARAGKTGDAQPSRPNKEG